MTKFDKLVHALAAKSRGGNKVKDPKALAAWIGRKKYGPKRFQAMAQAGRKGSPTRG